MDALLVDGDEIELTPDPPWMWMAPVRLSIMSTPEHKTKAKGKFAVWGPEIVQAGLLAAGKMYSAPGFATPGAVITCTIIVNPATMSQVYKDVKRPIATVATSGTFLATMAPAINPATGVPDPLLAKTGTWKVVTEKQSVAKSGQLNVAQAPADDADGKGGNASGGNSAESAAAENKVHWVGVKYQDVDGNPLPDHRIAISTPDGRRVQRKTTAAGASRVDGVRAEGEAVASLLEATVRPGVKQPPVPFIGVTVVDEDGLPIEGIELGFAAPSGAELAGETNTKGSVRIDKLPELGTWTVKVTGAPDGLFPGVGDGGADAGAGDGTGTGTGDEANTGDATATDKPTKRLFLLEVPDVLCRTNSCVILPEGEAPSASTEHPAVNGVGIFAAAIRLCEERPEFKLLIAAHTDSVDDTAENQALSTERAQMALAILTGDRESFKKLAHARHRISDYKQMLHWCVTAYPDVFTCDPGPINDTDDTWTPVHTFEQQYNECKFFFTSDQPDLKLTGEMGPMNWGALFDVLQHNIAQELGVTVKEVAALREKIKWLDDGRKALGFGEHHPIDAVGKDHYESQSNRRVELLFFKETDILPDVGAAESNPASSEIYLPGVYARERIKLSAAPSQTLFVRPHDEARQPMRNCKVEAFVSGESLAVSASDADGFHQVTLPPACPASVRVVWTNEAGDVEFEAQLIPECGTSEGETGQRSRLNNLGYPLGLAFEQSARLFQADYQVDAERESPLENGLLPSASRQKLDSIFDSCDARPAQAVRAFDNAAKTAPQKAPAGNKTPIVSGTPPKDVWVIFTNDKVDSYYKAVAKYVTKVWVKAGTNRSIIEVTAIDAPLSPAKPSPAGNKVTSINEAWQRAAAEANGGRLIWTAHGFGGSGEGRDFGLRIQESEEKLREGDTSPRKSNEWLLTNFSLLNIVKNEFDQFTLFGNDLNLFQPMFKAAREALLENQVKVVEVFGCNIGKEPLALARMSKLLQVDVIGYKYFSAADDDGKYVEMVEEHNGPSVPGTRTTTGTPFDAPQGPTNVTRVAPRPLSEKDPEDDRE